MNRYFLLAKRHFAGRQLGFHFRGRTKTNLPSSVRMNGRQVSLVYPDDGGYMSDIINLWLDDEYGLKRFKSAPQSIVDIGANIGLFSLWARHCFPNARLFAYEPNPRVIEFARKNLASTGATLVPVAVSNEAGACSMNDDRQSRLASVTATQTGDIEVTSFRQVVETAGGSIDLLKMDCEGGEWDIFSATDCFSSVGSIRMEFHLSQDRTVQDVQNAARQIGFTVDYLHDHGGYGIAWMTNRDYQG